MSGYTQCACRDCFDIAISNDERCALCHECAEAGCEHECDGGGECQRSDAYDCEDES